MNQNRQRPGAFSDGAPSASQPQYGQPQQPQYGQPQYGQPQYGQPSYNVPGAGYPQPPAAPQDLQPTVTGLKPMRRGASVLATAEGSRGAALRASIWLRYAAYLLVLVGASALTQAMLAGVRGAANGGRWMLVSAAAMLLTATLGTMRFPQHRNELIRQAKHFTFGIAVLPGSGLAVLMWATTEAFASQTNDTFASLLVNALPILFFVTVIVPTLVFIKTVAGLGNLYRTKEDDQENVARWTRQDGLQL